MAKNKQEFEKAYDMWETLSFVSKSKTLNQCASFYEKKAVEYIISNLPAMKKIAFSKEPLTFQIDSYSTDKESITFGNNIVFTNDVYVSTCPKKQLFCAVAKNSISATFVNIFSNTASNPNRKIRFDVIVDGYFSSITNEFIANKDFVNDMMAEMGQLADISASMGVDM